MAPVPVVGLDCSRVQVDGKKRVESSLLKTEVQAARSTEEAEYGSTVVDASENH
jgi:hypothetical protein